MQFVVADGWPRTGATGRTLDRAIQALLANHTLIVGQSRSGKTTAVRRIIEEITNRTAARVVILDPNADFKLLKVADKTQADTDKEFVNQWAAVSPSIQIVAPEGSSWGIYWSKLSLEEMAAFLRLTPQDTFADYRHLKRHYTHDKDTNSLGTLEEFLASQYFKIAAGEELERYRLRLEQLQKLRVWANETAEDLDSVLAGNSKTIAVNLATDNEQERTIMAARCLEALWRHGEQKRKAFLAGKRSAWVGTIIVIDEGHLFAPSDTEAEDPEKRLVRERILRLADQGKKLNLYLMVISQQPAKLHRDVLSEFNNRIILRMNERLSLKVLEEIYGGVAGRYDGALMFTPGEALVEGALLCDETPPPPLPRGIRFRQARTREGGGTPPVDWALPNRS